MPLYVVFTGSSMLTLQLARSCIVMSPPSSCTPRTSSWRCRPCRSGRRRRRSPALRLLPGLERRSLRLDELAQRGGEIALHEDLARLRRLTRLPDMRKEERRASTSTA